MDQCVGSKMWSVQEKLCLLLVLKRYYLNYIHIYQASIKIFPSGEVGREYPGPAHFPPLDICIQSMYLYLASIACTVYFTALNKINLLLVLCADCFAQNGNMHVLNKVIMHFIARCA